MPSERGGGVNCFALLSRRNECHAHLSEGRITAAWVSGRLDALSLSLRRPTVSLRRPTVSLRRPTVVVLDNATVHTKAVKDRGQVWQERGLFVWFGRSGDCSSGCCRRTRRTSTSRRCCGANSSTSGCGPGTMPTRGLCRRRHATLGRLDGTESRRQVADRCILAVQEQGRAWSRACYALCMIGTARASISRAKATKCRPASVSGSRS